MTNRNFYHFDILINEAANLNGRYYRKYKDILEWYKNFIKILSDGFIIQGEMPYTVKHIQHLRKEGRKALFSMVNN
jgi:hypothetical protein